MKGLEGTAGLPHAPKGMLSEVSTFFQLNEEFSLAPYIEQVVKDEKTCLGAQRSQTVEASLQQRGWIQPVDMHSSCSNTNVYCSEVCLVRLKGLLLLNRVKNHRLE